MRLFLVSYISFVSRAGEPFALGYEKNAHRQLLAARGFESETGRVVENNSNGLSLFVTLDQIFISEVRALYSS
jgi:hypothetical protein